MSLAGLDGPFRPVSSVHLGRSELYLHVFICDKFFDGGRALVIHPAVSGLYSSAQEEGVYVLECL